MDDNNGWPPITAAEDGVAPIGHNNPPVAVEGWPTAAPAPEVVEVAAGPAETEEEFLARRNAEIQTWLDDKAASVAAVDAEKAARSTVTKTLFPTPKKGTQRYMLNNGYAVKLVQTFSYKLGDKDKIDADTGEAIPIRLQIEELEERINRDFPVQGPMLIKRLIKWVPEFSGSEYEKITAANEADPAEIAIRDIISEHLTITPGSPQLTFEEPKGK